MLAFFKLEKYENQISNSFNSSNSWLELSWRKEKDSVQILYFGTDVHDVSKWDSHSVVQP